MKGMNGKKANTVNLVLMMLMFEIFSFYNYQFSDHFHLCKWIEWNVSKKFGLLMQFMLFLIKLTFLPDLNETKKILSRVLTETRNSISGFRQLWRIPFRHTHTHTFWLLHSIWLHFCGCKRFCSPFKPYFTNSSLFCISTIMAFNTLLLFRMHVLLSPNIILYFLEFWLWWWQW